MSRDLHDPVTILLVEDDPDHAALTQQALMGGRVTNPVVWLKDGAEALDYLFRRGAYAEPGRAPRPGLILLDLKLPKVDGQKVLQQIKDDSELKGIPVVMLTTSGGDEAALEAYRAGANSFVTKPVRFADFVEQVRKVKLYWLLTSRLPAGERP